LKQYVLVSVILLPWSYLTKLGHEIYRSGEVTCVLYKWFMWV